MLGLVIAYIMRRGRRSDEFTRRGCNIKVFPYAVRLLVGPKPAWDATP